MAESLAVARRIRQAVLASGVEHEEGRVSLRVSQGVAGYAGQGASDPARFFLQANEALKGAKRAGDGAVRFWDPHRREVSGNDKLKPLGGDAEHEA